MAESIMVEFPSSYEWLNMVDLVCGEITSEMGFSQDALNEISISVIEACTNALEHGNKCDSDLMVRAVFTREPGRITIEVFDDGDGFDYEGFLQHIPDPSNIHNPRGRGIYIMKTMMDHLTFEKIPDRGMKVMLRKLV